MKQISLATTGKREFLDEMNLVVPWSELVGLIEPHAPSGKTGRPPFAVSTMLRFGKTPSPRHLLEEHNLSIELMATINATLATRGLMLKVGTVVDATVKFAIDNQSITGTTLLVDGGQHLMKFERDFSML